MDAMLHNLNAARYLMGRRVVGRVFFSDDHTHSLACDDTQFLKVDFEQGASAVPTGRVENLRTPVVRLYLPPGCNGRRAHEQ